MAENVFKVASFLESRFRDYEILVVNDGSKDKTAAIVRDMQKNIPVLKLIDHPVNLGYAQALRTGFGHSTKQLVFYTDSDGQFDINELDKLLVLLDRYDIVTGYRIKRHDPLMRVWMAKIYNMTYRLLFGLKVKDIDCAFKLFRKQAILAVKFLPNIRTGVINAEVYLKAKKQGFRVGEVGVTHCPRLKGTPSNEIGGRQGRILALVKPRVYLDFLKDTVSLWLDLRRLK